MTPQKPALQLVHSATEQQLEWSWFCGRCAAPAPEASAPAPTARVCAECRLGLLLETHAAAVPAPEDAFLVIDRSLAIGAMSQAAERLLSLPEDEAINRPVADLLVPAAAEPGSPAGFAAALAQIAGGAESAVNTYVRPWNTFGVRMRARVTPCGPPRAALVVLDPSGPSLRAVADR